MTTKIFTVSQNSPQFSGQDKQKANIKISIQLNSLQERLDRSQTVRWQQLD